MPLFHLILIAVIQGLTEFLPISSSGHLILLPAMTGLPDQGLALDVAVHVGTLAAVLVYFRADVGLALAGLPRALAGRTDTAGARLALLLLIASVPVVIAGTVLELTGLSDHLRSIILIGWTMLIFGLLLYWADQAGASRHRAHDWTRRDALIMGLWQAIALLPGTSRSGITITGARFLGYARHDAARLSMLMSIPVIVASGVLLGGEAVFAADLAMLRDGAIAAGFAFLAALLALTLMMRLLRSVSFTPYVIYRVILGIVLLAVGYS